MRIKKVQRILIILMTFMIVFSVLPTNVLAGRGDTEIDKMPTRLTYAEGEFFDPTGLEANVQILNSSSSKDHYKWTDSSYAFRFTPSLTTPLTKDIKSISVILSDANTSATIPITVVSKELTGIEISTNPKVSYIEGSNFDPTGLEIKKNYNVGASDIVSYSSNPSDFGFSPALDASLTTANTSIDITLGGKTVNLPIDVVPKTLSSLSIKTSPNKTTYIEGNKFDPAGLVVTRTYNNGTSDELSYATNPGDFSFSPDKNTALTTSNNKIIVTVGGKTIDLPIIVNSKTLSSISVKTAPSKVRYIEGNKFDPSGLIVTRTYDNGSTEDISYASSPSSFTFSPSTSTALKTTDSKVTITVDGKTVDQNITVVAKTVISINVSTRPTRISYIEGNTFDPSDLVVARTYDNGTNDTLSYNSSPGSFSFSPSLSTGLKTSDTTVTITVNGHTTNQGITVVSKSLSSISVKTAPTKISYIEGNTFDPSGLVVTRTYDNGTTDTLSYASSSSGFSFSPGLSTGLKTSDTKVSITVGSKSVDQSISVSTKSITSISVKTAPTKISYIEGNKFDPAGLVITRSYNNGTSDTLSYASSSSAFTFSPSLNTVLKTSDSYVIITVDGKSVNQAISVAAKQVNSISVNTSPTKTSYIEGNKFEPSGLFVTRTYDNGTTDNLSYATNPSDFSFSPSTSTALKTTDSKVTITVDGKTVNQNITVAAKTVSLINVSTRPTRISYIEGNTFDPSGLVVTRIYDNGTTDTLSYDSNPGSFTFNPSLSTGLKTSDTTVAITVNGHTTNQGITVVSKSLSSISVKTAPTKISYIEGNTFDPSGLVVTRTYDNGTNDTLSYDSNSSSFTFNPGLSTGLKTSDTKVSIIVGGKSVDQPITVNTKSLSNITVATLPTKLQYVIGQSFQPAGLVVNKNYNNGDVESFPYSANSSSFSFSPSGALNTLGKQNITISVSGQSVTQEVNVIARVISSIAVTTKPKINYIEGQRFTPTGMVLTKTYNDGSTETLDYNSNSSEFSITPSLDTLLTTSDKVVDIRWSGFITSLDITVVPKSLSNITVTNPPNKVNYVVGQSFQPAGLIINKNYDNGDVESFSYNGNNSAFSFSPSGVLNTLGRQNITISVGGKNVTQEINVIARVVSSIAITTPPTYLTYYPGDSHLGSFDPTGLVISRTFNDGTSDSLSYDSNPNKFSFSPSLDTALTSADRKIIITSDGVTTTQNIKVLSDIDIKTSITQTKYIEGDVFNPNGLSVERTYNDGSTDIVSYASDASAFTFDIALDKKLTSYITSVKVTVNDKDIVIPISVSNTVSSIAVKTTPNKINYISSQSFNPTGLVVTRNYDNGQTNNLSYLGNESLFTFIPASNEEIGVGTQFINITVGGASTTQLVSVTPLAQTKIVITHAPTKTKYIEQQKLDLSGLVIERHYNDNSIVSVRYDDHPELFDVQPALTAELSTTDIAATISVGGHSAQQQIEVVEKQLSNIAIKKAPLKSDYIEGKNFDPTGLVITRTYDNGTSDEYSYLGHEGDFSFTPTTSSVLTVDIDKVVIGYSGKMVDFPIHVSNKTLTSISVKTPPLKLNYIEYNTFDPTGLIITKHFDNGTKEDITYNQSTEMGFSFEPSLDSHLEVSDKSVTITYSQQTVQQSITVVAKSLDSITVKTKPNKVGYIEGTNFDPTGLVLVKTFNNNTTEDVPYASHMSDFSFTPNTSSALTLGQNNIMIHYQGEDIALPITVVEKKLVSYIISTSPTKVDYVEEMKFDPTGMIITRTYDNGTSDTLSYNGNESMFSFAPDIKQELVYGTTKIIVSYENITMNQAITVDRKQVTDFTFKVNPTISYIENTMFDPTGLIITVTYDNGKSEDISYLGNEDKFTFSPTVDNHLTVDDEKVTIGYGGKTKDLAIVVDTKQVAEIVSIETNPKTDYIEEMKFDPTNLVIKVKYDNGDIQNIAYLGNERKFGFTPNLMTELSTTDNVVTITYGGKQKLLPIDVKSKQIVEITSFKEKPKTEYVEGTKFNPNSLVISVKYDNGKSEDIAYNGHESQFTFTPSLITELTTSDNKIIVNYNGKTKELPIIVNVKKVTEITSIKTAPKTDYIEGMTFNPTNLVINVKYDNNKSEDISYDGNENKFAFAPELSTSLGITDDKVMIQYSGKTKVLPIHVVTKQIVEITSIKTKPKVNYIEGTKFNPSDLVIDVKFDNGKNEDISYIGNESQFTFTPTLNSLLTIDDKKVIVDYNGYDIELDITVVEKTLESTSVNHLPKVIYKEGDTFQLDGLVLDLHYNNQTTEQVSYNNDTKDDFVITPSLNTILTPEINKIEINYLGKILVLPIEVIRNPIVSVPNDNVISNIRIDIKYIQGETVNFVVEGAGMDIENPVKGDIRYVPKSWKVNPSGSWDHGPYEGSFSTKNMKIGEHTLYVTFQKEMYNGIEWVLDDAVDIKSADLEVAKKDTIVHPDGSITTPTEDGNDMIIKPSEDGNKPIINPDGSITVPPHGSIVLPNDKEIVLPDGATISPNGEIIINPGDRIIVKPMNTIVVLPDGGIVRSDGVIVDSQGNIVKYDDIKDNITKTSDINYFSEYLLLMIISIIAILKKRKKQSSKSI